MIAQLVCSGFGTSYVQCNFYGTLRACIWNIDIPIGKRNREYIVCSTSNMAACMENLVPPELPRRYPIIKLERT